MVMKDNQKSFKNKFAKLSALADYGTDSAYNSHQSIKIDLSKIERDENQPRKHFDEDALLDLAESIKKYGVLEPIIVRLSNVDKGKYIIIAGERRVRACELLGEQNIHAVIRHDLDKNAIGYIQVTENLKRDDLKFYEIAEFIESRVNAGEKQVDIAKNLGIHNTRVSEFLVYSKAPEWLKEYKYKFKALKTFLQFARAAKDNETELKDYLASLDVEEFDKSILREFQSSLLPAQEDSVEEVVEDKEPSQSPNNSSSEESTTEANDSAEINNDDSYHEREETDVSDTSSNSDVDVIVSADNNDAEDVVKENNIDSSSDTTNANADNNGSDSDDEKVFDLSELEQEPNLPTIWCKVNGQEVKLLYTVGCFNPENVLIQDTNGNQKEVAAKNVKLVRILQ